MIATFNSAHVRHLLALSRAATDRMPTFAQQADPDFWRDDMTADRRKLLISELEEDGFPMSVKADDVDRAKLPAGLMLVGDEGVYLMSQASIDVVKAAAINDASFADTVDNKEKAHVAYAREANPDTMGRGPCYDAKRAIFGGDDGVEFLEAEGLEIPLRGETLMIDITPNAITIMAPLDKDDASPQP
jgi:hypothetical protein